MNRQDKKRRGQIAISKSIDTAVGLYLQKLIALNSTNGWEDRGNRNGADLINHTLKQKAGLKLYSEHNSAQKKGDKQIGKESEYSDYEHFDFYFTHKKLREGQQHRKKLGISESIAEEIVDHLVLQIDEALEHFEFEVWSYLINEGHKKLAHELFGDLTNSKVNKKS